MRPFKTATATTLTIIATWAFASAPSTALAQCGGGAYYGGGGYAYTHAPPVYGSPVYYAPSPLIIIHRQPVPYYSLGHGYRSYSGGAAFGHTRYAPGGHYPTYGNFGYGHGARPGHGSYESLGQYSGRSGGHYSGGSHQGGRH